MVPVIDTDDLARQVVEPGQPALAEIQKVFGPEMVDSEGALRRDAMARLVFSDPKARVDLEKILHPRISELWQAQAENWRRENQGLGVVVIPLLFETQAEKEFDATVCVACSPVTQRQRLRDRGWSMDEISNRMQAQMPVGEKMAKADFVLWTESTLDLHQAQLERVLSHFRSGV